MLRVEMRAPTSYRLALGQAARDRVDDGRAVLAAHEGGEMDRAGRHEGVQGAAVVAAVDDAEHAGVAAKFGGQIFPLRRGIPIRRKLDVDPARAPMEIGGVVHDLADAIEPSVARFQPVNAAECRLGRSAKDEGDAIVLRELAQCGEDAGAEFGREEKRS